MKMRAAALILFMLALVGCGSGSDSYDINTVGEGQSEPVPSGGIASFTMTVNNAGPDDAGTVVIENQLGRGLSLLDITCAPAGGARCPGSLSQRMSVDAMPAGATLVFTVRATTAPGLNGSTSNTMLARSTVASEDPNQENDLGVAAVLVYSANLVLNYTVPETVAAGTDAVFVATVTNGGPADARNVVLTHTPPAGLSSGSITCQATDNAICPGLTGDTMTVPLLPVGSSLRFQIPVPIALDTRGPVSGQFTVDSLGDPVADNNQGSATTTVVAPSATTVVSHTVPATVIGGTPAVFTATVSNRGPNDARDLALTFTLPAGASLGSITCTDNNNGASCPATPGLLSTVPLLPVGISVRLLVSVPTTSTQRGELTAMFQATAEGDAISDDNQRSATTTVRAGSADLAVSHSVPLNVNGGTTALFTATVDNQGPEDARDITLTHKLPVGYAGSFVCTAAGGAVCPAALGATMNLPLMKSGGALRLQVSVPVALATRGSITAEFSAITDGDPLADNNSRSVTTTAVAAPTDLSVRSKVPGTVTAGTDAVFTATVYNGGPNPSTNAVLVFIATGGSVDTSRIACTPTGATPCPTLGTLMSVPTLGAGESLTFTFPVPVALGSTATLSGQFKATADGDPSNTRNTETASTVAVVAAADLQVAHTVPAITALGSTAEFVATVTNYSQRDAGNVTLSYAVISPFSAGAIGCEPAGGATCPIPGATMDVPLLPARASLRFRVPVAASQVGTIQASFTASFAGDPDTGNNQATTLTTVVAPASARSDAQTARKPTAALAR